MRAVRASLSHRSLSDALNGPPRRKHALGTMRCPILQSAGSAARAADLKCRDARDGGVVAIDGITRGLQRLGRHFELPAVRQALRVHAQCSG